MQLALMLHFTAFQFLPSSVTISCGVVETKAKMLVLFLLAFHTLTTTRRHEHQNEFL